jgi:hypothetical protein
MTKMTLIIINSASLGIIAGQLINLGMITMAIAVVALLLSNALSIGFIKD